MVCNDNDLKSNHLPQSPLDTTASLVSQFFSIRGEDLLSELRPPAEGKRNHKDKPGKPGDTGSNNGKKGKGKKGHVEMVAGKNIYHPKLGR